MAFIKDGSSMLKAILSLLVISFFVFIVLNNLTYDSESPVASNEKTQTTPDMQVSSTTFRPTSIKQINSGADMLSLIVGEKFSLRTEFNGELDNIVLEVFNRSRNSKFTQLQSRGSDGSVSIVTLTPTLTNLLLKTPTNIFEYAGNEFNGILSQVANLDLSDDVREVKSIVRPKKEDLKRIKRSE